jgi:hypothetical protein
MSAWTHGDVPLNLVGHRIEHWKMSDEEAWFQCIGTLIELEGEPGMNPSDVEHMQFHMNAPCPTEGAQVWRRLD